jgi:hypothetical protein
MRREESKEKVFIEHIPYAQHLLSFNQIDNVLREKSLYKTIERRISICKRSWGSLEPT